MRLSWIPIATTLVVAAIALPAHAGGLVEVKFVKSDLYSDIGFNSFDRQRTLERIAEHIKGYGARLPDDRTLKVEVLDIDLAGELIPMRRLGDIRVLKGSVDWPRMHLRWTLSASDGANLQSGDDWLKDMAYLMRTPRHGSIDGLAYDLRLLDEWFAQRFGAAAPQ